MSNPARILEEATQLLPKGAFQRIALRREQWIKQFPHDKETAWWVDEPLSQACTQETSHIHHQLIRNSELVDEDGIPTRKMQLLFALPLLAQWRLTRGVYEFDETLSESLSEMEIDKIPIQTLKRMPEYAPYLRLNFRYAGAKMVGVWFSLFIDHNLELNSVRGIFHTETNEVIFWGLSMQGCETLDQAIDKTMDDTYADDPEMRETAKYNMHHDRRIFNLVLSHVLYLCSKEPDIQGTPKPIKYNKKKNLKHIVLPEQKDNMLMVGYKHGGVIRMWQENVGNTRQSDTSGLGMPKAPHLRKAHWHLYWTGKGRTVPILHWIPPTAVNIKDIDEVATHVRPVQDDPADAK